MTTSTSASAQASAAHPDGTITTVAGNGNAGWQGDGVAISTRLNHVRGVASDAEGNLYIADTNNHRVRKVTPDGRITTIAGDGNAGWTGDGQATSSRLYHPWGVAVDAEGAVFIADAYNHRIRKVTPDGRITTIAGDGNAGWTGDGQARSARLNYPFSVALDNAGNVYVTDRNNHRIRKITRDDRITTIAGDGNAGWIGDGQATSTRLNYPFGVAVGAEGAVYVADTHNHRIRKITSDGYITTIAGYGPAGWDNDGQATSSKLHTPTGLTVDSAGIVYIADWGNHRVRKVTSDGRIITIAGYGPAGFESDGGPAQSSKLYYPADVALDPRGNLFIGCYGNQRVRQVDGVARVEPPTPPQADLYGEVVAPSAVQRGQEFDLGARIKSRGPATVDGQYVTVVMHLAEGLVGVPNGVTQRLSRTFAGAQLMPYGGALDGVFRVMAPQGASAGVYESSLEIQYGGDLNLKNNTEILRVNVIVPEPIADETALTIYQDSVPEVAPGREGSLDLRFVGPAHQPVDPGRLRQVYTAPSGFLFSGQARYTYHNTPAGLVSGDLVCDVQDGGRTLIVWANPHLNTADTDTGDLVYSLGVQATPDATPGIHYDGAASIGKHAPVQLRARVTSTADQRALVAQKNPVAARVRPGEQWDYDALNMVITNSGQSTLGTHEVVFTAPPGMRFMEDKVALSRQHGSQEVICAGERSDGNRTLTCPSVPFDLAPGRWATMYPALEVDSDAARGVVRGGIQIGSPVFATGHATAIIE
ncbi:NHL repeat-containing protein [Streptomyces apocyni]|uniref:NHL repeat-containing protein n=1 Tax=Streptomyces apocyni TaxID=2654677 RepID=UPI0012E9B9C2|nr:NHL repeat-containing protein [Streptomyces apocyni]